jgi:hypothetical protein
MGAMTGRGAGYCAGYGMPGYMNPIPGYGRGGGWGRGAGRGFGRGFGGGGRGWRNRYYATGVPGWMAVGHPYGGFYPPYAGFGAYAPAGTAPEHELEALREQATFLDQSLKDVKKRIDELEAEAAKGKKK